MHQMDYNELVRIVWNDREEAARNQSSAPAICTLSEAVNLTIDRWAEHPDNRMLIIIREKGRKPITSFEALRAIYNRSDFPRKSRTRLTGAI